MSAVDEFRQRTRATWAAGDWDSFARFVEPVGARVLDRVGIEPGMDLVDVGTGTGGNVAIPAAQRGAKVVGCDVTPELFEHARRRAADAGVDVAWIEADAQDLPFEDASFDRVVSTFGAMFAPDHWAAAAELVRVCRPGGRIAMTTWVNDGFPGELFKLAGARRHLTDDLTALRSHRDDAVDHDVDDAAQKRIGAPGGRDDRARGPAADSVDDGLRRLLGGDPAAQRRRDPAGAAPYERVPVDRCTGHVGLDEAEVGDARARSMGGELDP